MNTFQRDMLKEHNMTAIKEIVKLYHPDLNPDDLQLKVSTKFDWIIIEGKGVNIGIEYVVAKDGQIIMSGSKPLDHFINAFNTSKFRAWRFYLDSKNNKPGEPANDPDINSIMRGHKILKPSAKEMYDYYHAD